jgi:hypothetical protein
VNLFFVTFDYLILAVLDVKTIVILFSSSSYGAPTIDGRCEDKNEVGELSGHIGVILS